MCAELHLRYWNILIQILLENIYFIESRSELKFGRSNRKDYILLNNWIPPWYSMHGHNGSSTRIILQQPSQYCCRVQNVSHNNTTTTISILLQQNCISWLQSQYSKVKKKVLELLGTYVHDCSPRKLLSSCNQVSEFSFPGEYCSL